MADLIAGPVRRDGVRPESMAREDKYILLSLIGKHLVMELYVSYVGSFPSRTLTMLDVLYV